jgi:hypothetical protein
MIQWSTQALDNLTEIITYFYNFSPKRAEAVQTDLLSFEFSPLKATEKIRELLPVNVPAGIRCVAVLDGIMPGRIFSDDLLQPTWAILQETTFSTIYVGGAVTALILAEVIEKLRQ